GKSTLARSIVKLIGAHSGAIRLAGNDLSTMRGSRLRDARQGIQMVFQDPFASLDPRMTVVQLVAQPLHVHHIGPKAERRTRATELLRSLGIVDRHFDSLAANLSG